MNRQCTFIVLCRKLFQAMRSTQLLDLEHRIKAKQQLSLFIKVYCIADIIICTIFWIWALYHVIFEAMPDTGTITFALVIISCILGLLSVYYYHECRDDRARIFGKFHCYTLIISHIFLCANYTTGTYINHTFFKIYI